MQDMFTRETETNNPNQDNEIPNEKRCECIREHGERCHNISIFASEVHCTLVNSQKVRLQMPVGVCSHCKERKHVEDQMLALLWSKHSPLKGNIDEETVRVKWKRIVS